MFVSRIVIGLSPTVHLSVDPLWILPGDISAVAVQVGSYSD
jgi:hypothetical protein